MRRPARSMSAAPSSCRRFSRGPESDRRKPRIAGRGGSPIWLASRKACRSSPLADLFSPLTLAHGPALKNRFMLAPLTNLQSHPDGVLSDDEFKWLTKRAEGGFGLTMTCAAHVQAVGQ